MGHLDFVYRTVDKYLLLLTIFFFDLLVNFVLFITHINVTTIETWTLATSAN